MGRIMFNSIQLDFLAVVSGNQLWLIYTEKEFTEGFWATPRMTRNVKEVC